MIDEKRLNNWQSQGGCLIPKSGAEVPSCHEYSKVICDCEIDELIRLARRGLWAQKYGIRALNFYHTMSNFPTAEIINASEIHGSTYSVLCKYTTPASDALTALPKEKE